MKTAIHIGIKDLRLRLRDRSAIIIAFIAPLVLATIISFAFGRDDVTFRTSLAIADQDGSEISKSFIDAFGTIPILKDAVTVKRTSADQAQTLVEKQKAGAAIVIPPGFGLAVASGAAAEIKVLRGVESPISAALAEAVAGGFVSEINSGRLAIQTAVSAGALQRRDSPGLGALVQKAIEARIPINLVDGPIGAREVKAASYFGPSMSIFFLLFTVQFGALGILAERRDGTLSRLLASPTKPSVIVAGKVLASFVLGLLSITSMIFATTFLLGANWGEPLAVAALTLAIVFAAMGVTGMVVVLAKTVEQAQGYGAIAAIGLALLGGNFIQVTDAPEIIRKLSLLTPNGWALRAFFDLSAQGGGVASILPALGAILAFGVVAGGMALQLGRKLVVA